MKKPFAMLTAFALCCLALPMRAADPADFLPAKSPALLHMDGARLARLQWIKEQVAQDKDLAALSAALDALYAKHNLSEKDFCSGSVYLAGDEDKFAFYAQTNVKEAVLPALAADLFALDKNKDEKLSLDTKTIAGRKVYVFKRTVKKTDADGGADSDENELALTYLAPDVVMGFDPDDGEKLLKLAPGKPALLAKIDRSQLLSLAVDAACDKDWSEQFSSAYLNMNLTGANQKDLSLLADVDFPTKEKAQELGTQLQMMLPMGIGMLFGKDQKLAGELMQSWKVSTPSEKQLRLAVQLPEAVLKAVCDYLQKPENLNAGQAAEPAPGQAAPAPAKAN